MKTNVLQTRPAGVPSFAAGRCPPLALAAAPTTPAQMTPRQREVLALLCEGLTNKHIARRLNIAGGTVKVHISAILRALEVATRLQAVVAARRLGLTAALDAAPGEQPQPGLRLLIDHSDRSVS